MPESSPGEDELAPPGKKAFPVRVFSSADGKWRRGALAPGRCAPEHLYDRVMALCRLRTEVKDARVRRWRSAEYCRGALYAHSESHVLVVLRWAEGTYDMVELPDGGKAGWVRYPYMHVLAARPLELVSSSPDGGAVRYAKVTMSGRVRIWALEESSSDDGGGGGKLEWTLTHDKDLAEHPRLLEPLDDDTLDSLRMMALSRSPGNDDDSASAAVTAADDDEEEDAVDGWSKRWSWDEAMVSMPEVDTEPKDEAGRGRGPPARQQCGRSTWWGSTRARRCSSSPPARSTSWRTTSGAASSFPSLNAAKSRRRY
uniref:Uncharacterized protein n=1 Tax=Oryza brachyantha TaxID=4533 RepID=J3LY64_ORYBR